MTTTPIFLFSQRRKTLIISLSVIFFILVLRFAWVRTYYACSLTANEKIVDRVFFFPVNTTKQDTEASIWLNAHLGPTRYRMWHAVATRTFFWTTSYGFKPQSFYVYQVCVLNSGTDENYKDRLLDDLRKERQAIPKKRRGFEFEIVR